MEDDAEQAPVEIAADALSEDALAGLIAEFVTRDGTDYGAVELSLEEKAVRLRAQLSLGDARIVYDPETETANIVLARDLPQ